MAAAETLEWIPGGFSVDFRVVWWDGRGMAKSMAMIILWDLPVYLLSLPSSKG